MNRYTICAWAGFVAYTISLFLSGPAGFSSLESMEGEKTRLEANLRELEALNTSLAQRVEALRSDPEAIQIEARRYGYLAEGERLVQISSRDGSRKPQLAGRFLRFRPPAGQGGFIPLAAAFMASAIVFLLSLTLRREKGEGGSA